MKDPAVIDLGFSRIQGDHHLEYLLAERKDQLYYSITKVAENGGSGLSHESAVLVRDIFIDNCEGDRFFETVIESIGEAQKHIVNNSSILDRKQRKMENSNTLSLRIRENEKA